LIIVVFFSSVFSNHSAMAISGNLGSCDDAFNRKTLQVTKVFQVDPESAEFEISSSGAFLGDAITILLEKFLVNLDSQTLAQKTAVAKSRAWEILASHNIPYEKVFFSVASRNGKIIDLQLSLRKNTYGNFILRVLQLGNHNIKTQATELLPDLMPIPSAIYLKVPGGAFNNPEQNFDRFYLFVRTLGKNLVGEGSQKFSAQGFSRVVEKAKIKMLSDALLDFYIRAVYLSHVDNDLSSTIINYLKNENLSPDGTQKIQTLNDLKTYIMNLKSSSILGKYKKLKILAQLNNAFEKRPKNSLPKAGHIDFEVPIYQRSKVVVQVSYYYEYAITNEGSFEIRPALYYRYKERNSPFYTKTPIEYRISVYPYSGAEPDQWQVDLIGAIVLDVLRQN
jgi:hypothetical protein